MNGIETPWQEAHCPWVRKKHGKLKKSRKIEVLPMDLGEFCFKKEEINLGRHLRGSNYLGCRFGEVWKFSPKKKKLWSVRRMRILRWKWGSNAWTYC